MTTTEIRPELHDPTGGLPAIPTPRRSAMTTTPPVDELAARRAVRDANLRCPCGSEWFRTEGIVLAADGSGVTGHTSPVWCVECGAETIVP